VAAPYSSIHEKAEDAFERLFTNLKGREMSGVSFFKGFSASELSIPRLEIVAGEARPEKVGDRITGNWEVDVLCSMVSHAKDTARAAHQKNSAQMCDAMMRDDVKDLMNAMLQVKDFFVMLYTPGPVTRSVDGNEFRTEMGATIYGYPANEGGT
jgi:hypothetical protein